MESATVMLAEPSKETPLMVLAVFSVVAVAAFPVQEPDDPEQFPVMLALIVAGSFNVAFADPLTDTALPVLVPSESEMEMFLAVPQLAVVIAALPSKLVPLIALVVASLVAVDAFPDSAPENVVAYMVLVLGLIFTSTSKYGTVDVVAVAFAVPLNRIGYV